jgi:hypothetical protein
MCGLAQTRAAVPATMGQRDVSASRLDSDNQYYRNLHCCNRDGVLMVNTGVPEIAALR